MSPCKVIDYVRMLYICGVHHILTHIFSIPMNLLAIQDNVQLLAVLLLNVCKVEYYQVRIRVLLLFFLHKSHNKVYHILFDRILFGLKVMIYSLATRLDNKPSAMSTKVTLKAEQEAVLHHPLLLSPIYYICLLWLCSLQGSQ